MLVQEYISMFSDDCVSASELVDLGGFKAIRVCVVEDLTLSSP